MFWKTSRQRSPGQSYKNVAHPCPSRRYTNIKHDNEELPWNNGTNKRGEVTRTFVPSDDEAYHGVDDDASYGVDDDASYASQSSAQL